MLWQLLIMWKKPLVLNFNLSWLMFLRKTASQDANWPPWNNHGRSRCRAPLKNAPHTNIVSFLGPQDLNGGRADEEWKKVGKISAPVHKESGTDSPLPPSPPPRHIFVYLPPRLYLCSGLHIMWRSDIDKSLLVSLLTVNSCEYMVCTELVYACALIE